jgi:adenine phosphoribosyltransferase
VDDLKAYIREIPDFPKPGILFYDITTLIQDPLALRMTVDRFVWMFAPRRIDKVVGIESRGFLFGPIVAYDLNAGFVPVRKPGKLPSEVVRHSYELEYGSDTLEMHADAVGPGEQVLIVDDLLATGGTALAAARLIKRAGGYIVGARFVIDLPDLGGGQALAEAGIEAVSLVEFAGD